MLSPALGESWGSKCRPKVGPRYIFWVLLPLPFHLAAIAARIVFADALALANAAAAQAYTATTRPTGRPPGGA